jgi:hypothetical protein
LLQGDSNNSFAFYCNEDSARIVIANNAPKYGIQVYSFPGMERITIFPCPSTRERTSIGSVAVSPNGKLLLALGDNRKAFIYKIKADNFILKTIIQLPKVCFQASLAPTSQLFAVASDCGACIVYSKKGEMLEAHPICDPKSGPEDPTRVVRSVAFAKSKDLPLLAFAEQHKYISVVTYNMHGAKDFVHSR